MKVSFLLISFFFVILLSCTSGDNRSYKPITTNIRQNSLNIIVAHLSEENSIGDHIGIGGSSYRFDLYNDLNRLAAASELDSLTDHANPAVRYYSFRALVYRHNDRVFDILLKHMNDTSKLQSFYGCIGMTETVAGNFVKLVTSNDIEPTGYKLDKNQIKIIDSINRLHTK